MWPIFFALSTLFFKIKKIYYPIVFLFICSEVLIFLSGDRSAFFNINLSAIFIILFSQNLFKLRLVTMLSSILLIVMINFINPSSFDRVINKTIRDMNLNNKNQTTFIFSKQHTHHYITAYKMFLDNKIIGVGVKNFRNFCDNEKYKISALSCSTHPHNFYIQVLVETGIFGFVFLAGVLIVFCKYLVRHIIKRFNGKYLFNDFQLCILSAIAIYLWPVIPTGNIFNNWLIIIFLINIPFLILNQGFFKKNSSK